MLAAALIVVSLVVQGLTLEPLVRRAGIARPDAARHEQASSCNTAWTSKPPGSATSNADATQPEQTAQRGAADAGWMQ